MEKTAFPLFEVAGDFSPFGENTPAVLGTKQRIFN